MKSSLPTPISKSRKQLTPSEEKFHGDSYYDEMLSKRRNPPSGGETTVTVIKFLTTKLKKTNSEFDFSSFTTKENIQKPVDKKKEAAPKLPQVEKAKVVSMKSITENDKEKKNEIFHKKVEAKAVQHLDKYKQSNPMSVQLPDQEKARHKIRENFYYSLAYGLEECRLKESTNQKEDMREYIVEISKLLMKDEKSQLEHVRNLTLLIESTLYHKYNKDVSKNSLYINKAKTIYMHLIQKNNFDLRLKVLTEAISHSQLCAMSEEVNIELS